jgi:UV DNA damage repair endonuclease
MTTTQTMTRELVHTIAWKNRDGTMRYFKTTEEAAAQEAFDYLSTTNVVWFHWSSELVPMFDLTGSDQ